MTTTAQRQPSSQWPTASLVLGLLLAWTLAWYFDTANAIVSIWWRSETFTHGFLVVPIVLWMVWHKRAHLALLQPRPSPWVLVLLLLSGLGWLLGDLVAVNALTQFAFVALLALLVPTALGLTVSRTLAFPLAFLFFAVPFGEFAMPQLMEWTADFTVTALRLSGIPVYREGLQFVIPSGSWSVVEACSGVRYLIASVTVGTLFAYLNYQSTQRRVLFIIVSIIVPIIANWLRAYMIVMLGHLSGNKLAAGVDHLIYGWVFFGIVIMLMFLIGARWSEPEPSVSAADVEAAAQCRALSGKDSLATPAFALVAVLAAIVVALPLAARWGLDQAQNTAPVQLVAPPQLAAGWAAQATPQPEFQPAFNNPSAQINTRYALGEQRVGLYVGYYRQQTYQRKLVSSANVLVTTDDALWTQVTSRGRDVTVNSRPVSIREVELRNTSVNTGSGGDRLIAWQVYWVNNQFTASNARAKLQGALQRLRGQGDDSAVLILYTNKGVGDDGAQRLQAFMQANAAQLTGLLEATQHNQLPSN